MMQIGLLANQILQIACEVYKTHIATLPQLV